MKRISSRHLRWPNLLLIGVLVFISFSLRPSVAHPQSDRQQEKIGFIGDSITVGPKQGVTAVRAEMANLEDNYVAINKGVSGTTSSDWLPGGLLFDTALSTFKTQNVHTVSIMLGTNDSRNDRAISPAMYRRNMERIVESLLSSGVVTHVVLNSPPYVVVKSLTLWDGSSTTRLKQYAVQLDAISKRAGVARGDTKAFDYFKERPGLLADGVHPSSEGAESLGKMWADAYKKAIAYEISKQQLSSLGESFSQSCLIFHT
jgi:lysophospholipase L1-like esterase